MPLPHTPGLSQRAHSACSCSGRGSLGTPEAPGADPAAARFLCRSGSERVSDPGGRRRCGCNRTSAQVLAASIALPPGSFAAAGDSFDSGLLPPATTDQQRTTYRLLSGNAYPQ